MNRFILKKLIFTGTDKKPAIINFSPGFNVISGPSETGKSLIYECINYVLGATTPPKNVEEAEGYTNLFLTISTNNKEFTIERSVLSSDIRLYEVSYDDITADSAPKILSANANSKHNISQYLLTIIDISNKKLKRNEHNETISLTFNVLKNLLLVDESRIQAPKSPIHGEIPTAATSEKALFRFMITGTDYSNLIVQKRPEIRKADANARIGLLNHLIQNNVLNIQKDVTKEELEVQLANLERSIENEMNKISDNHQEIESLQEERKSAWDAAITAESKIDQLQEILKRFNLLKQYYQTDLVRLDAIIETGVLLSHTTKTHCPLCGAESVHHKTECVISGDEIERVKISCEYEKHKILSLQSDLTSTIRQVEGDVIDFSNLKDSNGKKYNRLDKLLNEKLEPSISKLKAHLHKLFETKKDVEIMMGIMGQIKEMEELKATAEKDLTTPPKQEKVPAGVQASEINELLKVIEKTLKNWDYPNLDRIGFSEKKQDITIGNKNRGDQGKGYRAITHAAVIISLMEFCVNRNMPHPGFVVLDSPLVTLRGADKEIQEDEAITDDMKQQFYASLSDTPMDRQIIVIENDDPPDNIIDKINYIHFTKDTSFGRYGFLPIKTSN